MESVEIQKTDSHSSHRPWKSPGDSHIPSGPTILLILTTGDQTSFGKVSPMSPGHNVTYVPGRTTPGVSQGIVEPPCVSMRTDARPCSWGGQSCRQPASSRLVRWRRLPADSPPPKNCYRSIRGD